MLNRINEPEKKWPDSVIAIADAMTYNRACEQLERRFCREIEAMAEGDESMIDMSFCELLQFAPMNTDKEKATCLLVASNLGLL